MATSGSYSFAVTAYDTIELSWTVNSQSTSNNSSNVTFKAVLKSTTYGRISSTASKAYTAVINGVTYTGYNTIGISANSSLTLFSKTIDISHDSSGAKTFTFSYTQTMAITFSGSYVGSKSGSMSITLPTIARASTITSASAVTLGGKVSVKFTPMSTSFYYKLKFVCGGKTVTTSAFRPATTSAYTYADYTMSIADWAPYITSATSATCTVTLYTYSDAGTTQVGSTSSTTFTVTVPDSVTPSVSASVSEGNSDITNAGIKVYVSGKSKLKVAVTATMAYSSAIASITVKIGSNSTNATVTTTSTGATATVTGAAVSGTSVAITVTVKDKRGRSATYSTTITQSAYSSPAVNTFTAVRCDADGTENNQGEYIKLTYKYTVTNISGNTSAMKIEWKLSTGSSYSSLISESSVFSSDTVTYVTSTIFSAETAFNFRITIQDAISSAQKIILVSTALTIMDFLYNGLGIAFGKVAEIEKALDSAWRMIIGTDDTPQLKIDNTGSSGWTGMQINSWSGKKMSFQIGTSGENRGLFDDFESEWMIYRDTNAKTYVGSTGKDAQIAGNTLTLATGDGSYTANDLIRKTLTYGGSNVGYAWGKVISLFIMSMTPSDFTGMMNSLGYKPLRAVYIPAIIGYNSGFYLGAVYISTTLSDSNVRIYKTYGGGVATVTDDDYKAYSLVTYITQ